MLPNFTTRYVHSFCLEELKFDPVLQKGIQDKNSAHVQCYIIFDRLIFHYFSQLMSVGLAWKSAAKNNEKLVNQKYATVFLSWLPLMSKIVILLLDVGNNSKVPFHIISWNYWELHIFVGNGEKWRKGNIFLVISNSMHHPHSFFFCAFVPKDPLTSSLVLPDS